jgi:ArsR family transcriptional regulator
LKKTVGPRNNERPAKRTVARNGADAKFRAFSDPTRLRILHLLQSGELCVGDLVKIIRVPQPTASRHLAYLRRAGLVITRKEGVWTYYALAEAENSFHQKLIECLAHCFNEVRELASDATRATKVRQSGGCCPK